MIAFIPMFIDNILCQICHTFHLKRNKHYL